MIERPRSHVPASGTGNLADILERVLDKGVVVAGDIRVSLLDIELLTIKLRLLIASADTAREMGIDWWRNDPFLSGRDRPAEMDGRAEGETRALNERLDRIESSLQALAGREIERGRDA